MKEEADFVSTIVRLMRLTRQGKLEWSTQDGLVPSYFAKIKNLNFKLEHVGHRSMDPLVGVVPRYRWVISDLEKEEEIVSLHLRAANDLAAIVRGYDEIKLEEVNRLLDAEL